ncbi:mono/diheme cytochrome c family protein [Variovorax ginsengisoli]|uniref:Mono/diheme cytochrome c family protein n=2 Tax=Variovorax ginsengisoli TaxID=363844 RepID=A0ABT9S670_9BURK|nr:mono/diheme cytochrome c family protein [Variovorax ginsengisoli]
MTGADDGWLNALIGLMQSAQFALLQALAALGLVEASHGQPGWPWPVKLSGENLLIDGGQARRLAGSLAVLALVVFLLLLAMVWRRRRVAILVAVPVLLLAAPWPDAHVVWVPATPASFHRSPSGFTVRSIAQGQALYAQHCVGCHGADGRGQGALADARSMSPPNLAGPLLWRRADGDLLWHVMHGMRARDGKATMPAFGERLRDDEAWALIDFMKAQAAGETLRSTGVWAWPAALPDAAVRCEDQSARRLASWHGQRVRIVAPGVTQAPPLEDPRLVTVRIAPDAESALRDAIGCVVDASEAADAWAAFALVTGTPSPAGTTLIADRDGWLRARSQPGQAGWSDDDLLCRTDAVPSGAQPAVVADGLGALIARMDAQPVRFVKGGFVH